MEGVARGFMSEIKVNKGLRGTVPPQMALWQLRWQQMRLEMLNQASFSGAPNNPSHIPSQARQEDYITA
jgi:hypothetical protein